MPKTIGLSLARLELMQEMWNDPRVQFYNDRDLPSVDEAGSVFLVGPTSRQQVPEHNWRCEARCHLREAGFQGYIYVPEPRYWEWIPNINKDYIHRWESSRVLSAKRVGIWIPRAGTDLLGLNTNLETGILIGRRLYAHPNIQRDFWTYLGWPPEAERMGLPFHYSAEIAGYRIHQSLYSLCYAIAGVDEVGDSIRAEQLYSV